MTITLASHEAMIAVVVCVYLGWGLRGLDARLRRPAIVKNMRRDLKKILAERLNHKGRS